MGILSRLAYRNLIKNKNKTIVMALGIMIAVFLLSTVIILYSSYNSSVRASYIKQNGDWHLYTTDLSVYDSILQDEIESTTVFSSFGYSKITNIVNKNKPYIYVSNLKTTREPSKPIKMIEGVISKNSTQLVVSNKYAKDYDVTIGDEITLSLGERRFIENNSLLWQNSSFNGLDKEYITANAIVSYTIVGIFQPTDDFEYGFSPGYACITYNEVIAEDSRIYIKFNNPSDSMKYQNGINAHVSELIQPVIANIFSESKENILLIVVVVLCLIIFLVCLMFIVNNYMINYEERSKHFAVLSSLGTSNKQLFVLTVLENLFVSIVVVPISILLSYSIVSLVSKSIAVMINNISFKQLDFTINYGFNVIAVIFCISIIVTTLASIMAYLIFSKRRQISPIKQNDDIKNNKKICKFKFKKIENELVYLNFTRRKKNHTAAIISVIISLVLALSLNSFFEAAMGVIKAENSFYYQVTARVTNNSDIIQVFNELSEVKGVKNSRWNSAFALGNYTVDKNLLSEQASKYFSQDDIQAVEYNYVDDKTYKELLNAHGRSLQKENYIAIAKVSDYDKGISVNMFNSSSMNLQYDSANYNNVKSNSINVSLFQGELPIALRPLINTSSIVIVVNKAGINTLLYDIPDSYLFSFECSDYLLAYSNMIEVSQANMWDVTINNQLEYADKMVNSYLVMDLFAKIFSIIIMFISIINLVSSFMANIVKKKKDVAVLISLGIQKKAVYKIIIMEMQLVFLLAIFISFILVMLIVTMINILLGFPLSQMPILEFVAIGLIYELILLVTTTLAIYKVLKGNIIANIKTENN